MDLLNRATPLNISARTVVPSEVTVRSVLLDHFIPEITLHSLMFLVMHIFMQISS